MRSERSFVVEARGLSGRSVVGIAVGAVVATACAITSASGSVEAIPPAGASAHELSAPGAATREQPPAWLALRDGQSQPQFSLADAIEQEVDVETTVDTDGDGRRDRVRIQIARPAETDTQGIDVPVIFEQSPYRGETGSTPNHDVDYAVLPQEYIGHGFSAAELRLAARSPQGRALAARAHAKLAGNLPGSLDDYYVPRGYAVVLGQSVGTDQSTGCPTVGDANETLATKAVIDWLNGRARGFDLTGQPVRADWTTGDVGMVGTSYNGTLPNQVATTGVEGLKTIVPISAISSWYDYYRANGLVRAPHSSTAGQGTNYYLGEDTDVLAGFIGGDERMAGPCRHVMDRLIAQQDRITGDYTRFWRDRDYLHLARRVKASVFVVHGLNDFNVMTKQFAEWWYRLAANDVPRKIWLHNGGHGGPRGAAAADYKATENRWFDHWLFGVDNGIMSEPRATVQRADGSYEQDPDWPMPGSSPVTLRLGAPNATEPGTLTRNVSGPRPRQSFVDDGRELDTDDVLIQDPDVADPNRLVYLSDELSKPARMSGTPWVTLRASIDNHYAANLTAVLVDYGAFGSADAPVMVTRGWLDPQNRTDVRRSRAIQQGREYAFHWDLQPDDHVFAAGHRIGLVVVSTDHDYTLRPAPGTHLTVFPARSSLQLPLVGGPAALGR